MSVPESPQPLFAAVSMERRIVELTILYEVSQALQNTLDEEKALYTILVGVTAGRGLGFNRAFILLVDHDEKFLAGRLAVGPATAEEASSIWYELRGKQESLGQLLRSIEKSGITRQTPVNEVVARFQIPLADAQHPLVRIMRSREAGFVADGWFEPHGFPVDPMTLQILGTDTFAVAPLYLADRELGLLLADNAVTRKPVDLTNVRLLQIYAQEASAAIQNTRLYRELMEKVDLCENTNVILRENQYHLLQAERLSTIGKMAALLAHEIRTPLVSIGGFARRLLRSTREDDPRKEEMEIIVSEVARLERLVQEVLGYSRITRPEYEYADVNELVRNTVNTVERGVEKKDGIRFELDLEPDLPPAAVDASQIRQALLNLISNGMDAMPSGGVLTISSDSEGDHLEIRVKDTGIGIAREHWGSLFSPFFTTKVTGTGLGLAIVSQVVENHKGSLRFESIPGQGTSFHIRLALNPQARANVAAHSPLGVAKSREGPQ
jgi:signal transduction histidine kinase